MRGGIKSAFKSELVRSRAFLMHPLTMMILADMVFWAISRGILISITETFTSKEEDAALKRVSTAHAEGRAFDVSTRGWTETQIKAFSDEFTAKYGSYGAIGGSGKPTLIVRHDTGRGDHFHVQVSRKYSVIYDNPGVLP
jgi:hypothetical protein